MEPASILLTSTILLAIAAAGGLIMAGMRFVRDRQPPAWLASGAEASGRFLAEVGLPMPSLNPEHALVLKVTAL